MEIKKNKGITLIALVITIIILLILAAVTIAALSGDNGILKRAGEAKDKTDISKRDENNKLSNYESIIDDYTYTPIEDINDEIDGLPEKKTAEELPDYIPIYTTEQLAKVATEETCEIKDKNGVSKGIYTMSVDAKYALMNDLDFQGQSTRPIKNFAGEFEGNGCTITNVNINTYGDSFVSPNGNTTGYPGGIFGYVENGKISNLAVTNSTFSAGESEGAIVGQGNNINIENCYSKNNKFNAYGEYATGSIIGYVYKNGATINKCKAIYTERIGDSSYSYCFGGICGESIGAITISNCKVIGNNSENNNYEGGIMHCTFASANIMNCAVQNIRAKNGGIISSATNSLGNKSTEERELNIVNCSVKGVKTKSAGIVSYISNYYKTNIDGCKVEKLTLDTSKYSSSYPSGICSTSGGKITINNCSVIGDGSENNKFKSGIIVTSADDTNISNCRVQDIRTEQAGIIGNATRVIGDEAPEGTVELNISNCSVKNTYTEESGIIYFADTYFKTNITKCRVENLTLEQSNKYSSASKGGIVGIISNYPNITDCRVKDFNIAAKANVGGIVGSFIRRGNDNEYNKLCINNCKVENVKFENVTGFGGIIGNSERIVKIENCNVNNIEGESSSNYSGGYVGGIAGNFNGHSDNNICKIQKCSVNGLNIKSEENIGGIIGYGYNINISDCNTSDSNIEMKKTGKMIGSENTGGIIGFGTKGTISNCTAQNINSINEKGRAGGIIGGGTQEVLIENCNVNGGSITSTSSSRGLGGICGVGTNVTNCTVENFQINAPNTIGVAGIVGHGMNNVSTSLIQKCKVKNCTIKGKDYVGGIAGAAFINISDCQVEDSTIEGTDSVGGIQGLGGIFGETDIYVPVKIDKGEVKNTEIKGSTNVNKIQGQNTYIINSAEPTQDSITNCKYNGNNVTQ